jgi:2-polyprenyl-6-methoxyphenol hydroxylase-like FAD-dependent oxidoreductase
MTHKRSVAIIGAGQTGVSAAIGFLNAGFDVTLFSDRHRHSLRDDVPASGTAVTFAVAQAAERELGLDDYSGRAPRVTGQSTQVFSGRGGHPIEGRRPPERLPHRWWSFRRLGHHRRNTRRRSGRA